MRVTRPVVELTDTLIEAIPKELKDIPRWVAWRLLDDSGNPKPKKVPINPATGKNAKSNDPASWGTFDEAVACYKDRQLAGIGIVLVKSDDLSCIDLDKAIGHNGNGRRGIIDLDAQRILKKAVELGAYYEISQSGDGLHVFCRGVTLSIKADTVEVYSHGRFIAITGKGKGDTIQAQELLDMAVDAAKAQKGIRTSRSAEQTATVDSTDLSTRPSKPFDIDEFNAAIKEWEQLQESKLKAVETKYGICSVDVNDQEGWRHFINACVDEHEQAPELYQAHIKAECERLSATSSKHNATDFEKAWIRALKERGVKQIKTKAHLYIVANALNPVRTKTKPVSFADPSNPCYKWPEPEPLEVSNNPAEPYPVGALPSLIEEAVNEQADIFHLSRAMVAIPLIATGAYICQGYADIIRGTDRDNHRFISPVSAQITMIADPAQGKSTIFDTLMPAAVEIAAAHTESGLVAYENQKSLYREYETKIKIEEQAAQDAYVHKVSDIIKKYYLKVVGSPLAKGNVPTTQQWAAISVEIANTKAALFKDKPAQLPRPRAYLADPTKEAMVNSFSSTAPSVLLLNDDAGKVYSGHSMKDEASQAMLATMSIAHYAGNVSEERSEMERLADDRGYRLTSLLMSQPKVFKAYLDSKGGQVRDMGTMSRQMLADFPKNTVPRSYNQDPQPKLDAALARFKTLASGVLPTQKDSTYRLAPIPMIFTDEAFDLMKDYLDLVEINSINEDSEFSDVRDFASRSPEMAARLAAMVHIYENGVPFYDTTGAVCNADVGVDSLEKGIMLAYWHLKENQRVINKYAACSKQSDALLLRDYIQHILTRKDSHEQKDRYVYKSRITPFLPRSMRSNKRRRDTAFHLLARYLHIEISKDGGREKVYLNPLSTAINPVATEIKPKTKEKM